MGAFWIMWWCVPRIAWWCSCRPQKRRNRKNSHRMRVCGHKIIIKFKSKTKTTEPISNNARLKIGMNEQNQFMHATNEGYSWIPVGALRFYWKRKREREQAQNLNLLDTNLQSCSSIDPTSKKNINKSNEKDEENWNLNWNWTECFHQKFLWSKICHGLCQNCSCHCGEMWRTKWF